MLFAPAAVLAFAFALFTVGSSPTLSVAALPKGAPRCIISKAAITAKHGNPTQTLGFAITAPATYTPGSAAALPIQLTGLPAFTSGGILAYVNTTTRAAAAAESHVGAFMATTKIRAQTASACQAANVSNESPTSTITHSAPLANTAVQTLWWTPPAANVGTVQVNVVVATGTVGKPWMILQSVMVAAA
ncbi:hypothetical protein DFJ73DRAFT_762025 [Zopfochytrium polystomum]|nr:hypothetical protein DFJ73DRAFT_762025 [Zopfochytrium polystomum]